MHYSTIYKHIQSEYISILTAEAKKEQIIVSISKVQTRIITNKTWNIHVNNQTSNQVSLSN